MQRLGKMSDKPSNPYEEWLVSDNNLCIPVLDRSQLGAIFALLDLEVSEGPRGKLSESVERPKLNLDLEHLQVADYGRFGGVTEDIRAHIAKLNSAHPISSDELYYIALQSLIGLTYPVPNSNEDLLLACDYEAALHSILLKVASDLSERLRDVNAHLPYWGRLAFLRVMTDIPHDALRRSGIEHIAVTLIKRPAFNATSFVWNSTALVGLNYALEPILKHLNRFLLSYFHTQQMAGPRRMERAFKASLPIIFHFWGNVSLDKMHSLNLIFDQNEHIRAHRLTADQVDFIVAHELIHIGSNHGRRLKERCLAGDDAVVARHEFEFSADVLAVNNIRAIYADFKEKYEAVILLFLYMSFVEKAGAWLRERLGGEIKFREQSGTHPSSAERLLRIRAAFDVDDSYKTEVIAFAEKFFSDILDYADGLADDEIRSVIQSAIKV